MSISCITRRPRLEYSSGRAAENPPYPLSGECRLTHVRPLWLDETESLEAISQNDDARRIFLRMASLSQTGRTPSFVEEYLVRTHRLHQAWRSGRSWIRTRDLRLIRAAL